jgi:hypothetical protein
MSFHHNYQHRRCPVQTLSQNYSPERSLVTNPFSVEDQRDCQRHDGDINPSHRAKGANITQTRYPPIDTVKEAKCHDVLRVMSVNTADNLLVIAD